MEYLMGSATAADDMISHSSGHLDSPLERKAAMERIRSGQKHATASLFKTDPRLANVPTADADGDGIVSKDEKASFAALRAKNAAKRAQDAAFRQQMAYQVSGVSGGGGYFGGRGAFLTSAKDRARAIEGDADGDGHVSLAERYDKDGDGKVEMWEYAAQTNSPNDGTHPVSYAADSCGVSAATRASWVQLREPKRLGVVNPLVVERVGINHGERSGHLPLSFDAARGGWTDTRTSVGSASERSRWKGPGKFQGNRNVKTPEQVAADRAEQARLDARAKADPVWARRKLGIY